ncbi:MAG: rhomboid family intramembrane serine protease [Ekhidna sp.]|nr:rhomboid family intramembrane serine protease [Ekhidna sp.]MBC6409038.1 rhomboid family intramembrane serine protease [Ekhidna sp.]MBC6426002.1 rhomboid family intramembrane serine protease [Ekhidna sp.]
MFRRLTPVAKNILIINAAIFFLSSLLRLPLSEIFGLRVFFSSEFAPYQFLTYMWLHGGTWHLIGNMIAVLVFAPMLEMVWGSKKFMIFYLVCGIGAGLLYGVADVVEKYPFKSKAESYLNDPNPKDFYELVLKAKSIGLTKAYIGFLGELSDSYYKNETYKNQTLEEVQDIYDLVITNGNMIGASGAVFGILFAFAFLFPNTELFLLFPPIPIKAKYLVFFYAMYELYAEFTRTPGDNVAHLAHLSGMLIAFILLKIWKKDTRRFY